MAQFPGMRLTVEGNKMILRSASGRETEQLKITKAVLGDGQITGNVDTLKSLVNPKLEVTISDEEIKDDTCIYHFLFDNKNVNQGFYWREIGLYGKNGNSGEEKLIAYSNANGLTSYIQDKTQPIPMQRLKIALAVGDNSNVQAVIDTSNAVDLGRVLKEVGRHNEDANVHSALMSAHNADKNAHEVITDVIKALKGTRAFDVSVSKSVTEIITLLGMGGIVAAKLDANAGFVKFANGFIIQWGLTWFLNQNTYCDVTLPIRCNVLVALCTDDSASTTTKGDEFYVSWNSGFSNNNRTSIRFLTNRGNAGNFTWLCLGIS